MLSSDWLALSSVGVLTAQPQTPIAPLTLKVASQKIKLVVRLVPIAGTTTLGS